MKLHDYLYPEKLGWVHLDQDNLPLPLDLFSWGIALDPTRCMIAGMFAGRKASLDEFHLALTDNFRIQTPGEEIKFSGFSKDAYQKFDQPLPNGQGVSRLYLHKGASSDEPVEMGGILFFYIWGSTPQAPDFELWANKMQDVHRIPVRKTWYPLLWEIMVTRGWVQPCRSINFGPLWEVSVTSEEWQEMIMENLDVFERRKAIGTSQQDYAYAS